MRATVVRCGMVIQDIVSFVGRSHTPLIMELSLQFSASQPVELHVNCVGALRLDMFVTTPSAVMLLVCIGVGGCRCPISLSVWWEGMALRKLM